MLVLLLQNVLALPLPHKIALANSLIVGRSVDDLPTWTCGVCQEQNKPFLIHFVKQNKKDVKALITLYNDTVVLAFRHTQTALNILQDILFMWQTPDKGTCQKCKVQAVFNNMWDSISQEIITALKDAQLHYNASRLTITGISLGGALACLSYIDLSKLNLFPQIDVVTFGAPRVGNTQWAQYFQKSTNYSSIRYLIKNDPIPTLPACISPICNYKQTGVKYSCNKQSKVCTKNGAGVSVSGLRAELEDYMRVQQEKSVGSLIDHIKNYPLIYNYEVSN